jgi:hypothetical protein
MQVKDLHAAEFIRSNIDQILNWVGHRKSGEEDLQMKLATSRAFVDALLLSKVNSLDVWMSSNAISLPPSR